MTDYVALWEKYLREGKTSEIYYRNKYVWGIVNTVKNLAYYLYKDGSRARKVIGNFLSGFKCAIKTDGYNAYKMFEGETEENYHPYRLYGSCKT